MAEKYSFLVVKYPYAETALDALGVLNEIARDGVVKLKDAVAVTKTDKGKLKIHQTKDDTIGKGFLKGGVIGVFFAVLFGPAGWIAMGAAAGGLFAAFDRGIKNRLLKELGQDMTQDESALAILVVEADWPEAFARMKSHGFGGQIVVSEIVPEDMAEVEKLLEDPKTVAAVPEELDIPAAVLETPVEAPVAAASAAEVLRETAPLRVEDIEGIGPAYAEKLAAVGVTSTADLLSFGAKPQGRDKLAATTGISDTLILEWVHDVDLMRIPGVGPQYSDLLEAAGVGSPAELAHRNPANLAITFQEVVAARPGIVRRVPSDSEISAWIDAAGKLEKVVEH
jgi:uncharacterized membrane protein